MGTAGRWATSAPTTGRCSKRQTTDEEEDSMADIVMAYSASHAPMMAADRESAPREQADRFFGALQHVRERATKAEVEAVVMLSGEHFTNFFLDNLPQIVDRSRGGSSGAAGEVAEDSQGDRAGRARAGKPHHGSDGRRRFSAGAVLQDEGGPRLHDGVLRARPVDAASDGTDRDELHHTAIDDAAAML